MKVKCAYCSLYFIQKTNTRGRPKRFCSQSCQKKDLRVRKRKLYEGKGWGF